jgi:predicted N-formylglutamate amidohydrolase
LFSEITRGLDDTERQRVLTDWYEPHRSAVLQTLHSRKDRHPAQLHVAAHSFVPVWKGKQRNCDVGLLYDPRRRLEASFARAWRAALRRRLPAMQVRLNQPYRGWTDGLTTALRRQYGATRYVGIELEINQRLARPGSRHWKALQEAVVDSLRFMLERQDP